MLYRSRSRECASLVRLMVRMVPIESGIYGLLSVVAYKTPAFGLQVLPAMAPHSIQAILFYRHRDSGTSAKLAIFNMRLRRMPESPVQ